MTKEEAEDILYAFNICPIHGCEMVEDNRHPDYSKWVCPQCREIQKSEQWIVIQEALQILGLPLKYK